MEKLRFKPNNIVIHPLVAGHPVTRRIRTMLPDVPTVVRSSPASVSDQAHDPVGEGKRIWFLTASQGQLVKECPATPIQLCCRYRVINVITNCPIDCSYCILQGYINNPYISIHVNIEDIKDQVRALLAEDPHHIFRFGTGELSDSLALEQYTGFSHELAEFFCSYDNAFFEIKTKSHHVESLLNLNPKGKIGISWSINPETIIREEERGASSLKQRLAAAVRCQEKGFLVGLHFDPVILDSRWERAYKEVVELIFTTLDQDRMTWVSMGGFRYPSFLKPVIQERFPRSSILTGELFPGPDGKHRYLKKLRVEMYKKMVSWIHKHTPHMFIYFCMESPEVWQAVFGDAPASRDELDRQFAQRIRKLWERE
jgi:spore photoproduct lyase